jgi:hypothetical protein
MTPGNGGIHTRRLAGAERRTPPRPSVHPHLGQQASRRRRCASSTAHPTYLAKLSDFDRHRGMKNTSPSGRMARAVARTRSGLGGAASPTLSMTRALVWHHRALLPHGKHADQSHVYECPQSPPGGRTLWTWCTRAVADWTCTSRPSSPASSSPAPPGSCCECRDKSGTAG